jgi:ABC-type amino acid transport substrate-binding protein
MRKVIVLQADSNDRTPPEIVLRDGDVVLSSMFSYWTADPTGFQTDRYDRAHLDVVVVRDSTTKRPRLEWT